MERDVRAVSESTEKAMKNLSLLQQYGKQAWEMDLAHASAELALLQKQLDEERRIVDGMHANREARMAKQAKEIRILETDLFNYIRNNGKTLVQVKKLEKRAKELIETGPLTADQARIAETLV